MTTSIFNFEGEVALTRIKEIRKTLLAQPMSQADISRKLLIARATSYAFFRHLCAHKKVHIVDWRRDHNRYTALWGWGPGIDAIEPLFVKLQKLSKPKPGVEQPAYVHVPRSFKPQPVFRDRAVEMFFGPAYVGLGAELQGMRS